MEDKNKGKDLKELREGLEANVNMHDCAVETQIIAGTANVNMTAAQEKPTPGRLKELKKKFKDVLKQCIKLHHSHIKIPASQKYAEIKDAVLNLKMVEVGTTLASNSTSEPKPKMKGKK